MLTQEQIEQRLLYVTGSDAAIICGFSPFKTKLQLWMEKTGRVVAEDISHLNHIKFGNFFENGVAEWFEWDTKKITGAPPPTMLIHPEYDWMGGNIDRVIVGENAILECKTAFNTEGWGDGENIIPPYYLMQVAHYCAVGNFDRAYIAVVFAAKREMRWYQYDRNLELEEKLIAKEQDFWINYVKADVAPEPVNAQDILSLYKETKADPVIAEGDIELFIAKLQDARYKIKMFQDIEDEIKEKIQLYMQQHDTLLDNSGKMLATWRYTKPVKYFNKDKFEKEHNELYTTYVETKDAQRRFRLAKDKE